MYIYSNLKLGYYEENSLKLTRYNLLIGFEFKLASIRLKLILIKSSPYFKDEFLILKFTLTRFDTRRKKIQYDYIYSYIQ